MWHDGWKPESFNKKRSSIIRQRPLNTFRRQTNTLRLQQYPGHREATARLTRYATMEDFLEAVFSMRSVQRSYSEDERDSKSKRHTHPFVRDSAPHQQTRNCLTVTKIWSWATNGGWHQDRLVDWPSFVTQLWLWVLSYLVLRSELTVTSPVLSCIIRFRYQSTTTEDIENLSVCSSDIFSA
jgi:hypothetical protein